MGSPESNKSLGKGVEKAGKKPEKVETKIWKGHTFLKTLIWSTKALSGLNFWTFWGAKWIIPFPGLQHVPTLPPPPLQPFLTDYSPKGGGKEGVIQIRELGFTRGEPFAAGGRQQKEKQVQQLSLNLFSPSSCREALAELLLLQTHTVCEFTRLLKAWGIRDVRGTVPGKALVCL